MKLFPFFAALALSAASLPATAAIVTYDFSNLKYQNGSNNGFLPTEVLNSGYWRCTTGDLCSSDVSFGKLGGDLKYTVNGLTATATALFNGNAVSVVQDADNGYNAAKYLGAGLGVYHLANVNSDDNITVGESLKLTFSQAVTLTGLSLRSDGHSAVFGTGATFLLNGTSEALSHDLSNLSFTGTEFTFAYGGAKADQFYLGGITVSAVPEPSAGAMLAIGIGMIGFAARRRKTSTF
ncbi:MAG: PEP-CTERM sorting domain-containing protein [Herminiimonas sp.]|nr:PEP-CTERM sorting domain-containing protein [Herminiimonas sp.]